MCNTLHSTIGQCINNSRVYKSQDQYMKLLKYYINQRIATDNSTVQFKCLSKQLVQYLTQITPKYFQIQDLSKNTAT